MYNTRIKTVFMKYSSALCSSLPSINLLCTFAMHLYCTTNSQKGEKKHTQPSPAEKQTEKTVPCLEATTFTSLLQLSVMREKERGANGGEGRVPARPGRRSGRGERLCALQCLEVHPCKRNGAALQCPLLWGGDCSVFM